jgi:hypothetical protein
MNENSPIEFIELIEDDNQIFDKKYKKFFEE